MIDLSQIAGFDWDNGNGRKSTDKHGVSLAEAEQVFANTPLLLLDDTKHSAAELRYHALGRTHGDRRLQLTFTLRRQDTFIRIISARDMNRKERAIYAESGHEKET